MRSVLTIVALAAPLLAQLTPPLPPPQNPLTPEKVMLGKLLFWEEQLSSDSSVACGTCHQPEFGGSDGRLPAALHPGPDLLYGTEDDIHGSQGVVRQLPDGSFAPNPVFGLAPQVTRRTSPTNLGAGHHANLFWDLRAGNQFVDPETGQTLIPVGAALEVQSLAPILNEKEMARDGRTWQDVRLKLQAAVPMALASNLPPDMQAAIAQNPTYPALFAAAYGDPAITAARIAFALASYQRTQDPDDTPWDRFQQGQPGAMTALEQQGWSLFQNQARCSSCHWEPLFSDDLPHNLGLRWAAEDPGAFPVTFLPEDIGAFKTPTLRNAGLRPRLFHNGQSASLADPSQLTDPDSTLNVYLVGGGVDPTNLDPFLLPLNQQGLTANDLVVVQEFVRTALTDPRAQYRLPPFDHPDLRSLSGIPPRVFGGGLAGAVEPFLIDSAPAFPGNADYRLGLAGGDGAGFALLTWGTQSIEPQASVAGLPWHLQVAGWIPFALDGQPGQVGHATWHLPLPNDPALATVPFYFQLFVQDPLAPAGVAASKGWEFFVR